MTEHGPSKRPAAPTNGAIRLNGHISGAGDALEDDQTSADRDQTLADTDQTGADHDQTAADNDQAAADSDQAASDQDLAHGGDADTHDRTRDLRDHSAQQREQTGQDRVETATARDEVAHRRDLRAVARDEAAAVLDRELAASDAARPPDAGARTAAEIVVRTAENRRNAAADRAAAAEGRARAAADREQAARDRRQAARDREQAGRDREQAGRDRVQAQGDREALLHQLVIAETDGLTGTRTRSAGLLDLDHEIDRARRIAGALVVVFVDVVGLKATNDADGHATGDALLRHAVEGIRRHLRSYDSIVRLGGDEFLCVMAGASPEEARARFTALQAKFAAAGDGCEITVGFAALTADDSAASLIERADTELRLNRRGAR